jgi:hypothetical protein
VKRKLLLVAAALALTAVPAADAKFRISLAIEPAQPWAKRPAWVTLRTGIVLPKEHGLRLDVVGPGATRFDTAFFKARLRRTGPKTYGALIRFARGGRWRLIVPNWGAPGSASPPPVDRVVTVRPRP